MRAAAIFGLGCSENKLKPFQTERANELRIGMPLAGDADVILLFGGDGTIHRHLSQLVELAIPLLVVPVGSGNDFARALGLRSVRDSVAAWRKFSTGRNNVQAIDLGVITPLQNEPASTAIGESRQFFCSVAGVGLSSEVTLKANRLQPWLRGHGGYALTLAPTLFRFAPFPLKISLPGEVEDWTVRSNQPTMLAAFANTSTYGGGMKIAPRAKMDDGQLDVCVIGGIDPFKLACMFPTVYFGKHLAISGVDYFQARNLRVETEFHFDVYADGEYVCQTPVEVGVAAGALKVLTP
jgi:diacylglycerol kinase (ATP)